MIAWLHDNPFPRVSRDDEISAMSQFMQGKKEKILQGKTIRPGIAVGEGCLLGGGVINSAQTHDRGCIFVQ
jgi:hypothetical protein